MIYSFGSLMFGLVSWHCAESEKRHSILGAVWGGWSKAWAMVDWRWQNWRLLVYILNFLLWKKKMRSPSLCVFLCECFVRVESWEIFLASFWKPLRAITIIGTALLRLFINPCPSIYLFLIFFLYTCKWIYLDFYCAYPFNLLFMDLFYLICWVNLCSFIYLFIFVNEKCMTSVIYLCFILLLIE